jgi:hypothetical protein
MKKLSDPDELVGRKVLAVYESYDDLILLFEDSYMKIAPSCYYEDVELDFDNELTDYERLGLGLISQQELDEIEKKQKTERQKRIEDQEIRDYQRLKAKYER